MKIKKLFLALTIVLISASPVWAEPLKKLDKLRPVLEHMQTAMKDTGEMQYLLIRCSGLFYGAANAEHQRAADVASNKEKRNKLLLGPQKGLAKELKGFGKDLNKIAIQLQLKFDDSQNNKKSEKKSSLNVNLLINDFNLMYTHRMFDNLESYGTITKSDKLLAEDMAACIGMHQQLFNE